MFTALHIIAERKIEKAIRNGELNTENWHGRPLPLEENQLIPDDMKMAYKILKNAGYLPPEIETRKEIQKLEELIASTDDEHQRLKQLKKLNFLKTKVASYRNSPVNLEDYQEYHRKIVENITMPSCISDIDKK